MLTVTHFLPSYTRLTLGYAFEDNICCAFTFSH